MGKPDNGGPAFPTPQDRFGEYSSSMTLRDWFAGQALPQAVEDYGQPNLSGGQQRKNHGNPVLPYSAQAIGTREEIIARQAYCYADAMLEARK